jgi:4-hydroxythreonine-4-phosphate dehydrogenase
LTPLAVSLGEPAGIGPDVILMAYAQRRALRLAPFVVFGDAGLLQSRARRLGLDLGIAVCEMAAATAQFDNALPVIEVGLAAVDNPGQPDGSTARLTIAAIERAVASVRRGDARAVVTAPISKAVLYDAGFRHPGHTEFLAALCAENGVVPRSVMMLADDRLRVVPATIHIPLADVVAALTQSMLVETFEIVGRDLRNRFGIETPRIGVTGLNPHAGEGGAIGARGDRCDHAGHGSCRWSRLRVDRADPCRHAVHARTLADVRRGGRHVSRPGVDPDQDRCVRSGP